MTGFGSPCGACKFLRRKCARGCVFAPYFCHEQGAAHFAAIHKVFGASNVSKLLMHLPVQDRLEAAVTISYEAQARLQDPIYGCVSHIFALQQQVVNLQVQLASLKAQAAQTLVNGLNSSCSQEDKSFDRFLSYQQSSNPLFQTESSRMVQQQAFMGTSVGVDSMLCYENGFADPSSLSNYYYQSTGVEEHAASFITEDDTSHSMASFDMQTEQRKWPLQDMEDLQSVAFGYLRHS
ncbi:LOB domain-containing protein 29-like [Aristolochia californica]|uniref:LOB domain-containing protein 29-like n=1 Tax=Aristolochia californica TaxID=171875 RepID=UPI0035E28B85